MEALRPLNQIMCIILTLIMDHGFSLATKKAEVVLLTRLSINTIVPVHS